MSIFSYKIEESILNKEFPVFEPGIYYCKLKKLYHKINEQYNTNQIVFEFHVSKKSGQYNNVYSIAFNFADKNKNSIDSNLKCISHIVLSLNSDGNKLQEIIDTSDSLNDFTNKLRLFIGKDGAMTECKILLELLDYNNTKKIGINRIKFPFFSRSDEDILFL
jgi:hypothetical protein